MAVVLLEFILVAIPATLLTIFLILRGLKIGRKTLKAIVKDEVVQALKEQEEKRETSL